MTSETPKNSQPGSVQYINPDSLIKNPAFTQIVAASGPVKTLYIGMQNAVTAAGLIIGKGDIGAQTEQTLKNVEACLEAGGALLDNLVLVRVYVVQGQPIQPGFEVFQHWWGDRPHPPANTVIIVQAMGVPDFLVGIEAIAVVPQ